MPRLSPGQPSQTSNARDVSPNRPTGVRRAAPGGPRQRHGPAVAECAHGATAGRVQPLRGDLRSRVHPGGGARRGADHRRPGEPRRPAVARAHLPQGGRPPRRPRGPRPAAASGPPHRGHLGGDRLGRGSRPGRDPAGRDRHRARPGRAGDLPRQPQRAQPRLDDPRHRDGEVLPHPQQVQRHLGRPAARPADGLPDVRPPADAPGARRRPHPVLPGRRGQPDGLERQPDDGAGLPGPAARPQGPRRPDGGARPPAHRDRPGRARAPLRPPGHRRPGAAGDGARAARRGADHSPGVRRRARRRPRGGPSVHPGAGRRRERPGRRRGPAARPGARRGRVGRRLRTSRESPPRSSAWSRPGRCSC